MSIGVDKLFEWWLSPLSGAFAHAIDHWVMWHARLMVLAWAVLLPLGALAARYLKVMPKQDWPRVVDNRTWWHIHRILQYGGVVVMLVGVSLVWSKSSQAANVVILHANLGWSVVALGMLQVVVAWMRGSKGGPTDAQMRGDHYDMTLHRLRFEAIHKTGGWIAILLAIFTVCLGLLAADAPRWMVFVLVVWWSALFALGLWMQRSLRCVDTYQAIWGPSLAHPGNKRPDIGWGAHRPRLDEGKL